LEVKIGENDIMRRLSADRLFSLLFWTSIPKSAPENQKNKLNNLLNEANDYDYKHVEVAIKLIN
jgi:hypothetical protein